MLIAGGYCSGGCSTKVDLVDLETGEICSFGSLPTFRSNPQGVYIDGKAWYCGYGGCFYWDGAQWVADTQLYDDCSIYLNEENAVYTPDGKWLVIEEDKSAIYDPAVHAFVCGPTLSVEIDNSACVTFIAKDKIAIMNDGFTLYTLDYPLTDGTLTVVGTSSLEYDKEGSCQTLMYNGVPTGKI